MAVIIQSHRFSFVDPAVDCHWLCCRVVDNGIETISVEEDGRLKSKTVNGVAVPIDVDRDVQQQQQQQEEQAASEL